jgi:hypothetical protein
MSVTAAPRPTPAAWPWLAGTAAALALWALLYSLLIPFSEAVTARLPVERHSHLGESLAFFLYDVPECPAREVRPSSGARSG